VSIGHENICCLTVKDWSTDAFQTNFKLKVLTTTLVYINAYIFVRNDREAGGGGDGVYIKKRYNLV